MDGTGDRSEMQSVTGELEEGGRCSNGLFASVDVVPKCSELTFLFASRQESAREIFGYFAKQYI